MMLHTNARPLSFAQQRLWFLDRMERGSTAYNVHVVLRLEGALVVASLERALGEVMRRHDTLRTTFIEVDDAPAQIVAPFTGFTLPVDDVSGLTVPERDAEVHRRVREHALQPFDLGDGPLLRAALLRVRADDHILLLGMHRVISDLWSWSVLFRELSVLYEAYRAGREPSLPALPIQYAEYAVWQRAHLEDVVARDLAYWEGHLSGAPPLFTLPADHPRPPVQRYQAASKQLKIPFALVRQLQAIGRGQGATLFMVLLGAFQTLLSKYTGSTDVVVGTPIAGRTRIDVEGLIGCFVNMLVLRTDLSGDPSLREVIRRVREGTLAAYRHQMPFERLVAALQPERSLSHSPLFQMMFALQQADGPRLVLPGLQVHPVETGIETELFDLSLVLAPHADGLCGRLSYRTDLFEPDTMARVCGHFDHVLRHLIEDPDRRLSAVTLVHGAERVQMLETWNRTAAFSPECTIHQLVESQAARTPDAMAVIAGDAVLTYAALNARADQLAQVLRAHGVRPEQRVGICLERSAELIVGLLGVLKAGGAYVPLDPGYPMERLAFMLADSDARILVTQETLRDRVPAPAGVAVVSVNDLARPIEVARAESLTPAATSQNLAYVIYTSGSTGRPKGVAITHHSVVNLLASMRREPGMSARDVLLAVTTISFDISGLELFLPLTTGATVALASAEALADPWLVQAALARSHATMMQATPVMWRLLIEADWSGDPGLKVLCGGEALSHELAAQLVSRCGELWNVYGPTETTIWSTYRRVVEGARVDIGRPIGNTQVFILDAHQQPQPIGVAGELFIGGMGLARGYINRPAMTAERFLPDPFGVAGGRLYRTGDRARWRPDGTIECLGRIDRQVKIRGFRIEPGEIEAVLKRDPAIREARVIVREDTPGEPRVVAYLLGDVDVDRLRTNLRRTLTDYMIPAAFVQLDALPVTPAGKVDVLALPALERSTGHVASPPRTPLEARVAEVWRSVLSAPEIGPHSNFFDLGGDSLLLIRVHRRLSEIRRDLRLIDLFRYQTVAELAAYLASGALPSDTSRHAESRSGARTRQAALSGRYRVALSDTSSD
jgi:amino acid adenylation domain-containing protein